MSLFNCKIAQDNFSSYIDNELAPDVCAQLEHHLKECPACSAELAEWRMISNTIRGLSAEQVAAPAALRDNILQALQHNLDRDTGSTSINGSDNGTEVKSGAQPARIALFKRAKQWAAVAAAALVLAFGSCGVGLQLANNGGPDVAINSNEPGQSNDGADLGQPGTMQNAEDGDETPGHSEGENRQGQQEPAGVNGNSTETNSPGGGSEPVTSGTEKGETDKTGSDKAGGNSQDAESGQQVALLAENMSTTTTSVWMESAEPEQLAQKVIQLAETNGASFKRQQLDNSLGGGSIISITMAKEKYNGLLEKTKKAGTVTGTKTEQIDLSGQYQEAYSRLQELSGSAAQNSGSSQIMAQLEDAENLVNRIETQSKSCTITIWIKSA